MNVKFLNASFAKYIQKQIMAHKHFFDRVFGSNKSNHLGTL